MKMPLSPLALCLRGFELYPGRPAVLDDNWRVTYSELRERAEALAGVLREHGVGPGDRVAVMATNITAGFDAYLGVPLCGGILVPLNIRLAPADLSYILEHSGCKAALVEDSLCERFLEALPVSSLIQMINIGGLDPGSSTAYETLLERATPVPLEVDSIDEDSLVSINYTSGTTARPKGVMQTHRNNYLNSVNMLLAMSLRKDDVHLHVAPMFHANGWGMTWGTLAVGAANVMLPRVEPADVFRRIHDYGVTTLCAAASVLIRLLEAWPGGPADHPVRVAAAGMAPPAEVIRRVEDELGWEVRHLYGLTESTAFLTYHENGLGCRLEGDPIERSRIKARQGVVLPLAGQVRVVHPDLTDVARDGEELGEVVARGNVIMSGYYRDPEATGKAFAGGWFHTGDLAVWHPDGYIQIKDRAKDIIISGGENISSLEVEGVLYRHPAVAQVAVVAGPHPLWVETPVAFVVPHEGCAVTEEDLLAFGRERLTHFKAPTRVVIVSELPRTATGKVQKNLLRDSLRETETVVVGRGSG